MNPFNMTKKRPFGAGGLRLLLVHADFNARDVLATTLADATLKVVPVHAPLQLRAASAKTVDGILLDVNVPHEFFQAVVTVSGQRGIPLLLLGDAHESALLEARRTNSRLLVVPARDLASLDATRVRAALASIAEGRHQRRAWVVTGDAVLSEVLAFLLERAGFAVEARASVAGVRRAVPNGSSRDVAIVDVFLPDGNGLSLLPLFRSGGGMRVLVLSGSGEERVLGEARRRGANGVLGKPLNPNELASHLAGVA